jgi:hypothetical protein
MKRIIRSAIVALLMAVLFSAQLSVSRAHHAVINFNLEEMVATSDRIFVGKCISIKETEEMIAQGILPVTTYTFEVSQVIKGQLPKTFSFKQHGHQGRKPTGKEVVPMIGGKVAEPRSYVHGMSYYNVGDEMMLMLIPQYMDNNFTYPVGLHQGAFYITRTGSGKNMVKNSINNRGLFTNPYSNFKKSADQARVIHPEQDQPVISARLSTQSVDTMISKPGALPLNDFVQLVSTIVEAERQ